SMPERSGEPIGKRMSPRVLRRPSKLKDHTEARQKNTNFRALEELSAPVEVASEAGSLSLDRRRPSGRSHHLIKLPRFRGPLHTGRRAVTAAPLIATSAKIPDDGSGIVVGSTATPHATPTPETMTSIPDPSK